MKTTIVAEAGINHVGVVENAVALVVAAKKAGADAVKFQLFNALSRPFATQYILTSQQWENIVIEAARQEIRIFWSVFDQKSVMLAKSLKAQWIKLSFVECRNSRLIKACNREGFERKFMSIGLYGQNEQPTGWEYLYCPNNGWSGYYPTIGDHIEWGFYAKKAKEFGLGFSCHCQDLSPCVLAASLGAKIIEKHLKLENVAYAQPDDVVALTPGQFATMVKFIRLQEKTVG